MLITKSSFDKYPNIFLLCNFKLFLFAVHKTKSLHVFDVRVWLCGQMLPRYQPVTNLS